MSLMEVSLTPQSEAFVRKAVAAGHTIDDVINRALALLQKEQEAKERHTTWLRDEIRKGEEGGVLAEVFDFEQSDDQAAFWADIDELSDKMLSGEVPIRPDSAALPPIHS